MQCEFKRYTKHFYIFSYIPSSTFPPPGARQDASPSESRTADPSYFLRDLQGREKGQKVE